MSLHVLLRPESIACKRRRQNAKSFHLHPAFVSRLATRSKASINSGRTIGGKPELNPPRSRPMKISRTSQYLRPGRSARPEHRVARWHIVTGCPHAAVQAHASAWHQSAEPPITSRSRPITLCSTTPRHLGKPAWRPSSSNTWPAIIKAQRITLVP